MRKAIQGACPERSRRGFTIIEIITTIAIIGILAGIVLVAWNVSRTRAKDARIQADITQLGVDAIAYGEAHGRDWSTYCDQVSGTNFANLKADIMANNGGSEPICRATPTAWIIIAIKAKGNTNICTDSTGKTTAGEFSVDYDGNIIDGYSASSTTCVGTPN